MTNATDTTFRVLFICSGNSARSQMAEGWLRSIGGDRFDARSAGTRPRDTIHPLALQVMSEVGIDMSNHQTKGLTPFLHQSWDFVITVCDDAREECPAFPGASQHISWSFKDPVAATGSEEERLQVFRRVRNEIQTRVRLFASAQTHSASTSVH